MATKLKKSKKSPVFTWVEHFSPYQLARMDSLLKNAMSSVSLPSFPLPTKTPKV